MVVRGAIRFATGLKRQHAPWLTPHTLPQGGATGAFKMALLPLRPVQADFKREQSKPTDLQGAWRDALARHAVQQESDVQPQAHARCEPPWFEAERRRKSVAVYGLAVRGELPDRLTVEAVVALGCLSLHAPLFQKTDADTLRQRLQDLLDAGLLRIDADGLIDRPGVSEVMPMLGLPDDCALARWVRTADAGAADKATPASAPKAKANKRPVNLKKAQAWKHDCMPLERVVTGADRLGTLARIADMVITNEGYLTGDRVFFTPGDLLAALKQAGDTLPHLYAPSVSKDQFARWCKALYPNITWPEGREFLCERDGIVQTLFDAFLEGEVIHKDGEMSPAIVVSLAKAG